jgi:hypothetical protein
MKRIIVSLIFTSLLLGLCFLAPHSVFSVRIATPTPVPQADTSALIPPAGMDVTLVDDPMSIPELPPTEEAGDPYGELYFTVEQPKPYYPPETPPPGVYEATYRLVRLPGSCLVGLIECPAPENVPTPFNMQDVLATDSDSGALTWSPDGRYGVIFIHPPDDFTKGWTTEEWEQFKTRKLEELNISASTLYLFDSRTDTWHELFTADRKFFYSARWSPDGQWIAFTVASSMVTIHPFQANDGVYIVRADGSDLQRLGGEGYILGWLGDSLILNRFLHPGSENDFSHVVEKLSLDGQVTKLFESSRLATYALAPDGGSLLAADAATREGGSPQKAVDVLALDGSVIRSFGTFSNFSSAVYPFVWSPDGSQVAFASLRRLYVAPRVSQLDPSSDTYGVPPDTREVYAASDAYSTPTFNDLEFSCDNKFLLTQVTEGFTHFVVMSLESGQSMALTIPHLDPFVADDNNLGDPTFFSWRQ